MLAKLEILKNSKVIRNGSWLFVLQIFNTIIPLITLPYIVRILGSSQFGVFAFALNIVGYFQVIVEYGFNLSGSRKLAITNDKDEISKIFSVITTCKLLLSIISFTTMLVISTILKLSFNQYIILLILFSIVLGAAIQQTWLFQGMQVMRYITITSVISRTISVALIFLLIKNDGQVYLYSALYAITSLLIGTTSLLFVKYKLKIKFRKVSLNELTIELKDGWYLFTTNAMTKIFSTFGITILGIFSTDSNVGIYSAIQKVPLIMTMFFAPIGQALFPFISQQFNYSFENGIKKVKTITKMIMPIVFLIGVIVILISEPLVDTLFGKEYSEFSTLVIPLVFWFVFSILNNLLGIQVLVASGYQKEYSKSFRVGVVSIIFLNIVLGVFWDMYGVAIAAMVAEFILTIMLIYYIRKIIKASNTKGTGIAAAET
jgi:polysaccharide transporter, PST family